MRKHSLLRGGIALLFVLPALVVADTTRAMVDETISKPVIRGGIVYKHYCALCHGESGNGTARASKLYKHLSLKIVV